MEKPDKNDKKPECAGFDEPVNNEDIKKSLKELKRGMDRTNFFFHLIRNNPRHREQYYFGFIAIVGYENWKRLPEAIRVNWESARLSFDKMYGMVKDFKRRSEVYSNIIIAAIIMAAKEQNGGNNQPNGNKPSDGDDGNNEGDNTGGSPKEKDERTANETSENIPDEANQKQVGRIDLSLNLTVDNAKIG